MDESPIPRFFVRANVASAPIRPVDPGSACHAVDLLRIGTAGNAWVVALDEQGVSFLVDDRRRGSLPLAVQEQLTHHEVACGGRIRRLEVSTVWLLGFQMVEQPDEKGGMSEPVYLYGTLTGPFPSADGQPAPVSDGQLTVTRGELLDGFAHAAEHAFRIPATSGGAGPRRAFHLLLPGGRVEDLAEGRDLVLAYPMLPPETGPSDAANEILVNQLLYDTLQALQGASRRTLPVPSRPAHVSKLRAEGFDVHGNLATRAPAPASAVGALFAPLLRLLLRERRLVPAEGTTAEYLDFARAALRELSPWPDARAKAVRARVEAGVASARPVDISPAPPPLSPRPPHPAPAPRSSDWTRDFVDAHPSPAGKRSRVTSAADLVGASDKPDWMRDFETGAAPAAASTKLDADWRKDFEPRPADGKPAEEAPKTAGKPDWMKDFE